MSLFASQPELQIYWYLLQAIALFLPLNNIFSALLGGILILLFLVRQGWRSLDTTINRGWLGLSGWLVITSLTAFDPSVAWTGLFNFLPFFLLFAIASRVIQSPDQFRHILKLLVVGSVPVSGLGILQVVINQPTWTLPRWFGSYVINLGMSPDHRIASLFGHYNELGIYLVMILMIAAQLAVENLTSKWERYGVWIILGMGAIALAYSGSRSAWVLMAIGIGSLAVWHRYWYVVAGITAIAGSLSWAVLGKSLGIGGEWLRSLVPVGLINRLDSAINPSSADYLSTVNRVNAWAFAVDLIQRRPIQGWGFRSFEAIALSMNHDLHGLPHEHNFYLTLAVGGGIPALIGFMTLVISVLVMGIKRDQNLFGVVITIALFFLSGLLDVTFYEPRVNILSWLLLAGVYSVSIKSTK